MINNYKYEICGEYSDCIFRYTEDENGDYHSYDDKPATVFTCCHSSFFENQLVWYKNGEFYREFPKPAIQIEMHRYNQETELWELETEYEYYLYGRRLFWLAEVVEFGDKIVLDVWNSMTCIGGDGITRLESGTEEYDRVLGHMFNFMLPFDNSGFEVEAGV